ncbi:MAG: methyltransferase domain-containing protein [Candidatus Eremiobacteraeota bacterium]|nr:methyltransferase domain-containing protein [Candidatus Eremiobacteraeota bacterium]
MTSRELALATVRDVFGVRLPHRGAHEAFDYRARRSGLDARDRAFAAELAYGAIKARRYLDWVLQPYLEKRKESLPPTIAEILRLGAYQLREMSVPPRAAVSESVGLAKRFGHRGTAGLVNAVLRRVSENSSAPVVDDFASPDDFEGTLRSYPTWIVTLVREIFGQDRLDPILAGMNARARTALRVNLLRTEPETVLRELADRNVAARRSEFVAEMLLLDDSASSEDLANATLAFEGTAWDLQGEIAAVPVDLLDPQPGERVLDLAAGRGNKTLQIAGRLRGEGDIEAVELDPRTIAQAQVRLNQFAVENVRLVEADIEHFPSTVGSAFDRVLLDAPCSGFGILGRQPEARWRKQPADPPALAERQARMLEAAAACVRAGGRLVYSVCTFDRRETVERVAALLEAHPDFVRVRPPASYESFATADGDLLIAPGIDGRDGFFVAVVEKAG